MIETITIDTEQWAVVQRVLLEEITESLACELDARYPACNRSYPSQERKYLAEMEPVIKAREILAAAPRHEAGQQTCTVCHGQTGYEADELYGDRVTGRHWVDCDHCKGDGVEPQQSAPRPVPTSERVKIAESVAAEIRDAMVDAPLYGVSDISHVLGVIDNYIAGLVRPAEPDGGAV